MKFPHNPCWDFALAVYRRRGVEEACLTLQERHGVDVNVLLFCCWLGASGRGALSEGETAQALAVVGQWHGAVVGGLRAVRGVLKGGLGPAPRELGDALRRQVLACELDAEHVQQIMLCAAVERPEPANKPSIDRRAGDAAITVARYFAALGVAVTGQEISELEVILGASFPQLEREKVTALCGSFGPPATSL